MTDDDTPDVATATLTQSAAAWRATLDRLPEVWRQPVQTLLDAAAPDAHGRIALEMEEWMAMAVVDAQDDALTDYLAEDQVL